MKCISVRQPWAWMIIHGGKDIENRDWRTKFRGRVLIHASKTKDKQTNEAAAAMIQHVKFPGRIPFIREMQFGGIVGSVEIVDCVERSDSPWFFGHFGFVLRNPQPLPFRPLSGMLGFFEVPECDSMNKCLHCGKELNGQGQRKYCSVYCRNRYTHIKRILKRCSP